MELNEVPNVRKDVRPPRVLLLSKRFPPQAGGVAQYSVQVGRAYARAGASVLAVTQASRPAGTYDDDVAGLEILNVGPCRQAMAFAKFLIATVKANRQRFDLVHATTWKMAVVARLAAPRVPLIVTVHGREALNVRTAAKPVFRWALRGAQQVFTVSRATMEAAVAAVGRDSSDIHWQVRYNGVSFGDTAVSAAERTQSDGPVEVLSLCRLVPRKNVEATLRAVARAASGDRQKLRLRIAGTGPDLASLQSLSRQLRLDEVVEFLGFVPDDDVPNLYAQCDIFIHPHTHIGEGNDFEGFGITIADAMSFGCAVLVGNAGGPAELVTDGVDGLLVDGTDQDEVAGGLERLLDDSALRRRIGRAAKQAALKRFSWDAHIEPALDVATSQVRR